MVTLTLTARTVCMLQLPTLTVDSANGYLSPFTKDLDDTAEALYEGRYLLYVRFATEKNKAFYVARCAAEMKKHVSYEVDVVIGERGAVLECQCECTVGKEPNAHCKHVRCLLFALTSMETSGDILTHTTCTQRLQTFHQCKPYKGSPQKVHSCSCDL